jgi:hypothetical protein
MATENPLSELEWLAETLGAMDLKGVLPGGVHFNRATQGLARYPYAVYGEQSPGEDDNGGAATRVMSHPLIRVVVIGAPGQTLMSLKEAYKKVDEKLQGVLGANEEEDKRWWVKRESRIILPEYPPEGTQWQLGGLYRFDVGHSVPSLP